MKNLTQSFGYALEGIISAFRSERNLKIHFAISVIVIIMGLYFHLSSVEWSLLFLTIGLMIVTELLNTSIERVVDLATNEYHPIAKQAKDIAAGACLMAALISIVIGLFIFLPKITTLISGLFLLRM